MNDLYTIMKNLGTETSIISDYYEQFGMDVLNVNTVLGIMGITAEQAAGAVDKLGSAYISTAMAARQLMMQQQNNINEQRAMQQNVITSYQGGRAEAAQARVNMIQTLIAAGNTGDVIIKYMEESQAKLEAAWPARTSGELIKEATQPMGFAGGGTVPGPIDSPQLAMVHGGERIIPANESSSHPIVINVAGSIITEHELGRVVRKELVRLGRLDYTTGIS